MMNIVIPMAGTGARIQQRGDGIPKMLIDVAGRPMFYWALDSLRMHFSLDQAVFVCLREHVEQFPLEQAIHRYCRSPRLVLLEERTQGQAHSVLLAEAVIQPADPLIIYNCDTVLHADHLPYKAMDKDGYLSVFPSARSGYSYIRTDAEGDVIQVEEKEVISPYASTGLYQFNRAELFLRAAEKAVSEGRTVKGEYYVAPLYMDLIAQGYRFGIHLANQCYPLGTPEELDHFLDHANREE